MKIAISGKGGTGKSTIAAVISLLLANHDKRVLAIDADPDANLASSLGMPSDIRDKIIPISRQVKLIEERTGAKVNQYGQIFKLNPEVSDISDKYAEIYNGVALLVLGAVEQGGGGCACPENVLIRALVSDLILNKDDVLVMDMEAGVEHLGRATVSGVDIMLIIIEPGQRSVDTGKRIIRMADAIGLKKIRFIANKVTGNADREFIKSVIPPEQILGFIPFSEDIRKSDMEDISPIETLNDQILDIFKVIIKKIEEYASQN